MPLNRAMRFACALTLLLLACREGPAPYELEQPVAFDSSGRLTYNIKDDRVPLFGLSNDTVVYLAQSYPPFGASDGMLLKVPRTAGTATPIIETVQSGVARSVWLSAPAISADGKSIAFWEITKARDTDWSIVSCPGDENGRHLPDVEGSESVLQRAVLRVRPLDRTDASDLAQLVINFEGRTLDTSRHPFNLPYVIINTAHPFHRQYERYRLPIFRASWAPDGTRLVFSDGLQLRVWNVGQTTTTAIPNTEDGILPAWSPDGSLIAFTKLVRGPALRITCVGIVPGAKFPEAAVFDRTIHTGVTRDNGQLQVVQPDGAGLRSLGIGEAPAWAPNSKTVVARRDGQIYKVPVDGSAASPIGNTAQGYEPGVSRDGRWVAFAKFVSATDYDIWVVPY